MSSPDSSLCPLPLSRPGEHGCSWKLQTSPSPFEVPSSLGPPQPEARPQESSTSSGGTDRLRFCLQALLSLNAFPLISPNPAGASCFVKTSPRLVSPSAPAGVADPVVNACVVCHLRADKGFLSICLSSWRARPMRPGTVMTALALSTVRLNDLPTVMQLVNSGIRIRNPFVQLQSLCFWSLRSTVPVHCGPGLTFHEVADPHWILFALRWGPSRARGITLSW